MEHSDIPAGEVHAPHNWRVADAAERLALIVAPEDLGKYCWQQDDNTEWFLTAVEPSAVWTQHIGPKGEKGEKGDAGAPGEDGADGAPGTPGAPGEDGREVELQQSATHIQWRYVGDTAWVNLLPLTAITGPAGADGVAGADGSDGTDGREIELQKSATHIQWRYVGAATWVDLVALAAITGPAGADGAPGSDGTPGEPGTDGTDGREVQLQTNATHVQWRYVGDPLWTDLVPLSAITGPAGADGSPGADGAPGEAGVDGRAVELQKSATHIQWRYVGDPTWTNLVALADLKGDKGDPGSGGAADPSSISITYNGDGSVHTVTTDGVTKTMSYNGDGTINTVSWPVGSLTRTETYTYSGGRLTGMSATEA